MESYGYSIVACVGCVSPAMTLAVHQAQYREALRLTAWPVPHFCSGATGQSGRFTEGILSAPILYLPVADT